MIVKVLNEKNKDFEFDETLAQNHVFCPKTSNAHKVLQRFTVTSSNGGTDDKSKDSWLHEFCSFFMRHVFDSYNESEIKNLNSKSIAVVM